MFLQSPPHIRQPVLPTEFSTENTPKTRRDENFPVGSFLIPRRLRADVHAYYRYARFADDIADSADLSPDKKRAQLDAMEAAVHGQRVEDGQLDQTHNIAAQDIGDCLRAREIDLSVATDLLIAFRMDADNQTYRTWGELIDYCRFSACPVGRFLLALHGEEQSQAESDALCSALQILNHVQDAKEDYSRLQRLYMPLDWLEHDGASPTELIENSSSAALNNTFKRMIVRTNLLIMRAEQLPKLIHHRSLAAEATLCLILAKRLSHRLHQSDPVSDKVGLTKFDWLSAAVIGLLRYCRP
jgi:squalene synthase HpnC